MSLAIDPSAWTDFFHLSGRATNICVDREYLLTRVTEKQYRVDIGIGFFYRETPVSPAVPLDRITQRMWERTVQRYLDAASIGFSRPSGKQLSFFINQTRRIPWVAVDISPLVMRPSSALYGQYSMTCPVIVHEVSHLLGLVDKYPCNGDGFPCRAVTNPERVMHDHEQGVTAIYQGAKISQHELNMILQPNCEPANRVYSECGHRAYFKPHECQIDPPVSECQRSSWLDLRELQDRRRTMSRP